jgi:hypothetical protein
MSDDTLFFFILIPSLVSIIFFPTGTDWLLYKHGKSKVCAFALILFWAHVSVGIYIFWFTPTIFPLIESWKTWIVLFYNLVMCIQYLRLANWIRKNG